MEQLHGGLIAVGIVDDEGRIEQVAHLDPAFAV